MNRWAAWFFCCCLIAVSLCAQEGVALAVLTDKKNPVLADAAFITLAPLPGLSLVEREEIRRIENEQALAVGGFGYKNSLQAGRLLRAKALVLVEEELRGDARFAAVRVLAVDAGVLLATGSYSLGTGARGSAPGDKELVAFQAGLRALVESSLPRLNRASTAVRVSLQPLRIAFQGAGVRDVEQTLNRGFAAALASEPSVLMLERHRLETLAWEKGFTAGDDTEFWRGACVAGGDVRHEAGKPDALIVNLRLRFPGRDVEVECRGSRQDMAGLVARLRGEVLKALGTLSPSVWDAASEAAQFAKAAERAYASRGEWDYIAGLADAAWVLGYRHPDFGTLRMESVLWKATGFQIGGGYPVLAEQKEFVERFRGEVKTAPDSLADRLDSFADACRVSMDPVVGGRIYHLRRLRAFMMAGEALRVAHEQDPALLNAPAAQELRALFARAWKVFGVNSPLSDGREGTLGYLELKIAQAPYWTANDSELIASHTELLALDKPRMKLTESSYDNFRYDLRRKLVLQPKADYYTRFPTQNEATWRPLMEQIWTHLDVSTDPEDRLAGWMGRYWDTRALPSTPKELDGILRMVAVPMAEGRCSVRYLLRDPFDGGLPTPIEVIKSADSAAFRVLALGILRIDLQTRVKDYDKVRRGLGATFEHLESAITEVEAKALVPLIEHAERTQGPEGVNWLKQPLATKFPRLFAGDGSVAKTAQSVSTPSSNATSVASGTRAAASAGKLSPLVVSRTWQPMPGSYVWASDNDYHHRNIIEDGETTWVIQKPSGVVTGISRKPGPDITIPLPTPTNAEERSSFIMLHLSAVSGPWIVLRLPGTYSEWNLLVYDRRSKKWTRVATRFELIHEVAHRSLIKGDYYYSSYRDRSNGEHHGFLRAHLSTGKVELLSHTGKSPAVVAANAPTSPDPGNLWLNPDGRIYASYPMEIYTFNPDSVAWSLVPSDITVPRRNDNPLKLRLDHWDVETGKSAIRNSRKESLPALTFTHELIGSPQTVPLKVGTLQSANLAFASGDLAFIKGSAPGFWILSRPELDAYVQANLNRLRIVLPTLKLPAGSGEAVFATRRANVQRLVWQDRDGRTRLLGAENEEQDGPVWSPDGKRLAYRQDSRLMVVDGPGATPLRVTQAHYLFNVTWSPDGARLAYWSQDDIWVVPSTGGKPTKLIGANSTVKTVPAWYPSGSIGSAHHNGMAWSPDGATLVFQGAKNKVKGLAFLTVATGAISFLPETNLLGTPEKPAWSPDGRLLAFMTNHRAVYLLPAGSLEPRLLTPWLQGVEIKPAATNDYRSRNVAWSRDGGRLAFPARKSGVPTLVVYEPGRDTAKDFTFPQEIWEITPGGAYTEFWIRTQAGRANSPHPDFTTRRLFKIDTTTGKIEDIAAPDDFVSEAVQRP